MSYADTAETIRDLPSTWIPALLLVIVETGYNKHVFQPGGASRLVKDLEERLKNEQTRQDNTNIK
jgi:hypothetical protein